MEQALTDRAFWKKAERAAQQHWETLPVSSKLPLFPSEIEAKLKCADCGDLAYGILQRAPDSISTRPVCQLCHDWQRDRENGAKTDPGTILFLQLRREAGPCRGCRKEFGTDLPFSSLQFDHGPNDIVKLGTVGFTVTALSVYEGTDYERLRQLIVAEAAKCRPMCRACHKEYTQTEGAHHARYSVYIAGRNALLSHVYPVTARNAFKSTKSTQSCPTHEQPVRRQLRADFVVNSVRAGPPVPQFADGECYDRCQACVRNELCVLLGAISKPECAALVDRAALLWNTSGRVSYATHTDARQPVVVESLESLLSRLRAANEASRRKMQADSDTQRPRAADEPAAHVDKRPRTLPPNDPLC